MKQSADELPNQVINRVLEGLGQARPPVGLEQRVLARMETRAAQKPRLGRPRWTWFAGAVGVCAAAIVAGVMWLPSARPPQVHNAAVADAAKPLIAASPSQLSQPQRAPQRNSASGVASHREKLSQAARATEPVSLAMEETLAPSLPSPPLPLTDQERVLLQVGRHPDPVQLAELNPDSRAAELAQARENVRQFFNPKKTQTNGDHQ